MLSGMLHGETALSQYFLQNNLLDGTEHDLDVLRVRCTRLRVQQARPSLQHKNNGVCE